MKEKYTHYYTEKEVKEVSNTSIHYLNMDYNMNGNAIIVQDGKPVKTFQEC